MVPIGEGIFETLRIVDSSPHALSRHLERMSRAAAHLRLPLPDHATVRAQVAQHFAKTPLPFGRLRIDWLADREGAALSMTSEATDPSSPTARLSLDSWRVDEGGPLAGIKSTRYENFGAARQRAVGTGFDDALLLNGANDVCETSTANIFYVIDSVLYTPPLSSGCLPGIARGLVMDLCDVVEMPTALEVLAGADEVFITSSLRAVQSVSVIDERAYLAPGPITLEAVDAWQRLAETVWDPISTDGPR